MAEMKSPENVKKARIRTSVAKIIVEWRGGRDYYSILYFDPSDGRLHIGFSSSNLGFVRKWLEEEFEVDESMGDDFANVVHCKGCKHAIRTLPDGAIADVAPVRHGRWEDSIDEWFGTDVYTCSKCRESYVLVEGTPKENLWNYCPNCGAKMDGEKEGNDG